MDDEQRVELMVSQGLQITSQAIEQFKPIAVVSAYSGGNDSIVSTHFGCSNFSAGVVHCNTGIGIQKTRDHVRSTCSKNKWNLSEYFSKPEGRRKYAKIKDASGKIIRVPCDGSPFPDGKWVDGDTSYEEYVLNFGFPGPGQHARMFQRLKQRGLNCMKREIKAGHKRNDCIVIISGIRHDESAIRAGYKRAVQKDGSLIWVNPFYWKTAADFEAYRQEFGLPRNPVSDAIGISGECLCGAFAREGELDLVRRVDPVVAEYIDGLVIRVKARGLPWGWGEGGPPPWYKLRNLGQKCLFEEDETEFMPMCVGCVRKRIVDAG